jgi:hypothetical protein
MSCADTRLSSSRVANSRVCCASNRPAETAIHATFTAAATSHPMIVDSCHGAKNATTIPAAAPRPPR